MSQALHPMLNIAVKAARAAGSIINRASLDLERVQVSVKAPNDFVTEVDQAAENAIIGVLMDAFPDHAVLGEETGRAYGNQKSDFQWVIDPLDGTTNFIHGLPIYAVSIALAFRGKVEQAVVYDPTRNDLFVASKGKGAYLNDRRLRVSKRIRLQEALIGTGFPFRKADNFSRYLRMAEAIMPHCAGLRRPGAASLDLCYVAAGYYDGFFETGLSPWDIAAGSLMITEAGGLVGNFTGEADFLHQREVVAGTPKIYGHLVKILTPFSRAHSGEGGEDTQSAGGPLAEAAMGLALTDVAQAGDADGDAAQAPAEKPKRVPVRIKREQPLQATAPEVDAAHEASEPAHDEPALATSLATPTGLAAEDPAEPNSEDAKAHPDSAADGDERLIAAGDPAAPQALASWDDALDDGPRTREPQPAREQARAGAYPPAGPRPGRGGSFSTDRPGRDGGGRDRPGGRGSDAYRADSYGRSDGGGDPRSGAIRSERDPVRGEPVPMRPSGPGRDRPDGRGPAGQRGPGAGQFGDRHGARSSGPGDRDHGRGPFGGHDHRRDDGRRGDARSSGYTGERPSGPRHRSDGPADRGPYGGPRDGAPRRSDGPRDDRPRQAGPGGDRPSYGGPRQDGPRHDGRRSDGPRGSAAPRGPGGYGPRGGGTNRGGSGGGNNRGGPRR